jgi:erythromycin esterase-like protein
VQNLELNDSKDAHEALSGYQRFPTWMWRNYQISHFVEWLRKHNDELEAKGKAENGWNRYDKVLINYIVRNCIILILKFSLL